MARFDLSDFEWSVIQPLLPNTPKGVRRVDNLAERGFEVLNEVVLNQVVATLPEREDFAPEIAANIQTSGEFWFGSSVWHGRKAIRLSVSS